MEITLDELVKVYEGSDESAPALQNVTTRIDSGEFFFLLGPSGCGKTTLLRLIAGLIEPTSGRIFFDNKDVTQLSVDKRNTALVFQGYALWPHMTVLGNVEFGPKMQGMARQERQQIAMEQLIRVQMDEYSQRKPNQLSGGQQQRVALARALAAKADCLLLDEPLSSLDARLRLHMRGELRNLVKSSGMTSVYVTHDQKEALSMADRIAVMNAGEIVQIGTPEDLYYRPATRFVADFLGEANFVDGRLTDTGFPAQAATELGTIYCSEVSGLAEGKNITCCVRPEHIQLVSDADETPEKNRNTLPARILSNTYLGEIRQYVCALGEDQQNQWKVTMLAERARDLSNGDNVFLQFSTDDVALLARD